MTDDDLLFSRSPVIIKNRLSTGVEFTDVGEGGHREKLKSVSPARGDSAG